MEIVRKLMVHMEKAEGTTYRDELMNKVIEICTQNNYQVPHPVCIYSTTYDLLFSAVSVRSPPLPAIFLSMFFYL